MDPNHVNKAIRIHERDFYPNQDLIFVEMKNYIFLSLNFHLKKLWICIHPLKKYGFEFISTKNLNQESE